MAEILDGAECGSAGSVFREVCEAAMESDPSPMAAPISLPAGASYLHPSIPVRFVDVVNELRETAAMAGSAELVESARLVSACGRAESLLRVLRAQFLQEVVLGGGSPGAGSAA